MLCKKRETVSCGEADSIQDPPISTIRDAWHCAAPHELRSASCKEFPGPSYPHIDTRSSVLLVRQNNFLLHVCIGLHTLAIDSAAYKFLWHLVCNIAEVCQ